MADLSQVRDTIAQNLEQAIYPNGVINPSIAGIPVTINAGFPIRTNLDKQLQQGNAMVSVYPTKMHRVVTKFQRDYIPNTLTPATITLTVSGFDVTITGTIIVPQVVMFIVNRVAYTHTVLESDTLDSIAAAMAVQIAGATSNANVVTLPDTSYSIIARVSTNYTASEELARVDQVFQITCWCPSENVRYLLGNAIDIFMKLNYRMTMVDNFTAQVFWLSTDDTDMLDKSLIYRRDLNYTVQYATTLTNDFATITDPYVDTIDFSEA